MLRQNLKIRIEVNQREIQDLLESSKQIYASIEAKLVKPRILQNPGSILL